MSELNQQFINASFFALVFCGYILFALITFIMFSMNDVGEGRKFSYILKTAIWPMTWICDVEHVNEPFFFKGYEWDKRSLKDRVLSNIYRIVVLGMLCFLVFSFIYLEIK